MLLLQLWFLMVFVSLCRQVLVVSLLVSVFSGFQLFPWSHLVLVLACLIFSTGLLAFLVVCSLVWSSASFGWFLRVWVSLLDFWGAILGLGMHFSWPYLGRGGYLLNFLVLVVVVSAHFLKLYWLLLVVFPLLPVVGHFSGLFLRAGCSLS